MKRKLRFIINPVSGVKGQKRVAEQINALINKENFDLEIIYTKAPHHATELSAEAAKNNYYAAIAVGGDGTVHETAAGLIHTNTALGILPRGSGNGLARHLGIPMNLDLAIKMINSSTTKLIDTIRVNEHFFVNMMGLGFDGHIAGKFAEHGKRGLVTYAEITLKEFMKFDEQEYEITFPSSESYTAKAFMLSIANSAQYGNNAFIAPQAVIDDGFFEICEVKKIPFYAALPFVVRLFTKTVNGSRFVKIRRTSECVIKNPKLISMHLDGEPLKGEAELHLKLEALSLLTLQATK